MRTDRIGSKMDKDGRAIRFKFKFGASPETETMLVQMIAHFGRLCSANSLSTCETCGRRLPCNVAKTATSRWH